MSISLVRRSANSPANPTAAWNWNPQVLASSDQLLRAVANGQGLADPQTPVPVHLQVTTLNRVVMQKAPVAQAAAQSSRDGPSLLLAVEPICAEAPSDDAIAAGLAPSGLWAPPAWLAVGQGASGGAGLPAPGDAWGVGGAETVRPALVGAARIAAEAQDRADPATEVSAPVTLLGLSREMAVGDLAEAPPFAGAVSGGFGPAFSGLPLGAGLEDVQPPRLTPRDPAITAAPDPGGGPIAPLDPSALAPVAAGGAPEPTTWAMTLVGLGGLGALLRRARAQLDSTASPSAARQRGR